MVEHPSGELPPFQCTFLLSIHVNICSTIETWNKNIIIILDTFVEVRIIDITLDKIISRRKKIIDVWKGKGEG